MSISTANCGFCSEQFNEGTRNPRVLKCLHTICNLCISQLIKNDIKVCPVCRTEFQAHSASDVKENEVILRDIRTDNDRNPTAKRRHNTTFVPAAKRARRLDKSYVDSKSQYLLLYAELKEQIQQIKEGIGNLEEDLKQGSNNIRQNVLPEIYKTVSLNDEMQTELQDMKNKLLNKSKRIESLMTLLAEDEESDDSDAIEAMGVNCDEWIRNCKRNLEEDEIYLRRMKEEVKKTHLKAGVLLDVIQCKTSGDIGKETLPSFSQDVQQNIAGYITVDTLREMSEPIKHLVDEEMVYAIQDRNEKRKYAKISVLDGRYLCINHLTEEVPANKVFILEYDEVLKIVSDTSRLTFLELRSVHARKYIGTLIIRLVDNSKRSENFWMMCSGLKGPSYLDSRLLEVSGKGDATEHVGFGDYEGNNGYGGMAVVPGAGDESGDHLKKEWLAGVVTGEDCYGGDETAAQFKIYMKGRPQITLNLAFGFVVKGLSSLTEAISRYSMINTVRVSECGIIIKPL